MKLRKWQAECVDQVLAKYSGHKRHFLCLATPGAGKTFMAAEVVANLFEQNLIDFVLCFSPSVTIANDVRRTMEERIGERLDGILGAKGGSFTYQSMQYLDHEIWRLLKSYRVLVIFDEIHHLAGSAPHNANAWGEEVIVNIQDDAAYTLALTGTPWRSDSAPIVLAEYQGESGHILCDYAYGLSSAITDGVCRHPQVVITDNDNITVHNREGTIEQFESFSELLNETACPYQRIVENDVVIRHIIFQASLKLTTIRRINPNAGGLVVASSVNHALKILDVIVNELNESAVIATYRENEPATIIDDFKTSTTRWIVSVGMISEGTNIPRLQVCCHLTRIKTELHFRQILGRILRINDSQNQDAFLYMPAEKTLIEYANRVAEDIPSENAVVLFEKSKGGITLTNPHDISTLDSPESVDFDGEVYLGGQEANSHTKEITVPTQQSLLTQTYEATLNVFGQFQQDILAINVSPFD